MNNDIINKVESLKHNTLDNITSVSTSKIPYIADIMLERKYAFDVHGVHHSMNMENKMLFLVKGLPLVPNIKKHVFYDNMQNMVDNKELYPFLLFIEGKFIKWSNIIIIKDCKYNYILIDNLFIDKYSCEYKFIVIPSLSRVKYTENINMTTKDTKFAFNNDGLLLEELSTDENITTVDFTLDDIIFKEKTIKPNNKYIMEDIEEDKEILKENLFFFKNGELCLNCGIEFYGLNTFGINKDFVKSTDNIQYKFFYYNKSNKSVRNILNIRNRKTAKEKILNSFDIPEYLKILNKEFNYNFSSDKTYEQNVLDSLEYIMNYNSKLINDVYKNRSTIISKIYTGKHLKGLKNNEGLVKLSRRIGASIDNSVIIFHNGLLYDLYNNMTYNNKYFSFPLYNVEDDDEFEFLFFTNVDNREFKMYLSSLGNDTYSFYNNINMNNMKLFTINPSNPDFKIERNTNVQYEIEYEWEKLDERKFKIIPKDNFYYDKNLILTSNRQFRYYYKNINTDKVIDILLPEDFRYCNDKNRYLVFINGRKIDNNDFKVTIPKETRPFDDLSIYVNIILNKGDKIEVFYVTETLTEIYTNPLLELSGRIVIDKSKIGYSLDKDIYFTFVNGRKLNNNQITNIDSTRIKINSNVDSINNICMIKYIDDDKLLNELFSSITDLETLAASNMNDFEIDQFYGDSDITSIETNMKENSIPMRTTMYKLIKDYWLRPYINNGDFMVYDFDDEDLDRDEDGNIIIHGDANLEDKI